MNGERARSWSATMSFFNSHRDQILDLAARTAWLSSDFDIPWD